MVKKITYPSKFFLAFSIMLQTSGVKLNFNRFGCLGFEEGVPVALFCSLKKAKISLN